jgi:hypothetical protein
MRVLAALSMLHEPGGSGIARDSDSATRLFRGEPVLAWTLRRLKRARHVMASAVMCWEDQLGGVERVAAESGAFVSVRTPRAHMPAIEAVAAAQRWSDGWRGGLLGSCDFDKGFYGPWLEELRGQVECDAILLVDPSAGLVDPELIDGLIDHAIANPSVDLCFSPAAPGLSATLIRPALLAPLASTKGHPGLALAYRPDQPRPDPIARDACAPIPVALARTTHRFSLDSHRQIERISVATEPLNGQLMGSGAEPLLNVLNLRTPADRLPREIVLELNTGRATNPIFWPGRYRALDRQPMPLETVRGLIEELAAAADDVRLCVAGAGDPLLHPDIITILEDATGAGIRCIALETDFQGIVSERAGELAETGIDIVSVHLPATTGATYEAVMGIDGLRACIENINAFLKWRAGRARGTPLLVPTFVKCAVNLGEMEAWYDHWLNTLNCAVIVGPGECGGIVPDIATADMSPPRRGACRRLDSRLTILCDGSVVSCEQDVLGRQVVGRLGQMPLQEIWRSGMDRLRKDHAAGRFAEHPVCVNCRQWHRS